MRIALALVAAIMSSMPVMASRPVDPRALQVGSTDQARAILAAYAKCLLTRERGKVDAFLAMDASDPAFQQRGVEISTSQCLIGGRLRFSPMLLRGALFKAEYQHDFADAAPPMMIGEMALAPAGVMPQRKDGGDAIRFTIHVADCIAGRDYPGARYLVLSSVGEKAESDALARLAPITAACAPGLDLAHAKEPIEAALAEVLYRRAKAATAVARDFR